MLPDKTEKVLIKELKYNAAYEVITHIDFARVAMDEFINVQVEIALKGIPKGVKEGGVLEHTLKSINIKCLPMAIPEKIEFDVSALELNGLLRVKDLVLPQGVTAVVSPDVTVAGVHLPKVEEVVSVAAEGAPAEPEVITAKKPAEDEAGDKAGVAPKSDAKSAAAKESKEHKK
jgi:large subunit ribosomal protein L25